MIQQDNYNRNLKYLKDVLNLFKIIRFNILNHQMILGWKLQII